jgi:hypothetical protein
MLAAIRSRHSLCALWSSLTLLSSAPAMASCSPKQPRRLPGQPSMCRAPYARQRCRRVEAVRRHEVRRHQRDAAALALVAVHQNTPTASQRAVHPVAHLVTGRGRVAHQGGIAPSLAWLFVLNKGLAPVEQVYAVAAGQLSARDGSPFLRSPLAPIACTSCCAPSPPPLPPLPSRSGTRCPRCRCRAGPRASRQSPQRPAAAGAPGVVGRWRQTRAPRLCP